MAGGDADYWRNLRRSRPPAEAIEPAGPGEESVWDYPRPPLLERIDWPLQVEFGGEIVASTTRGIRILETASPPAYYFPPQDVRLDLMRRVAGTSLCEWKGTAVYWEIVAGGRIAEAAAWSYPDPEPEFAAIRGWFSFYPGRVDACRVRGELASPQPGPFYGGWMTSWVRGPVKGASGTERW
ncbi:MAG: DUF427 domain-containing protein [Alphaproteobacteria bacterium]|nr:DUF427 domain-containing protein [Alphaproteobacteria bacterium]